MNYSKFIEHLKNTRRLFRWTLDKEGALRARLISPGSTSPTFSTSPTSPGSTSSNLPSPSSTSQGSPQATWFTPVTAVCRMLTGKYYPSINYPYAASEFDLEQSIACSIEQASDDVTSSTLGEQLTTSVNPFKIP